MSDKVLVKLSYNENFGLGGSGCLYTRFRTSGHQFIFLSKKEYDTLTKRRHHFKIGSDLERRLLVKVRIECINYRENFRNREGSLDGRYLWKDLFKMEKGRRDFTMRFVLTLICFSDIKALLILRKHILV